PVSPPPPPLTSTLSPYTTLFRSARGAPRGPRLRGASPGPRGAASSRRRRASGRGLPRLGPSLAARRGAGAASWLSARLGSTGRGDRKSTRLNSSHVKISYAVFCL